MDLDFILALNEVATRKNIAVDPQTLIYKILVDFGDGDEPVDISHKADHVFKI